MKLGDVMPEFAGELRDLLSASTSQDEARLAASVLGLEVVDCCTCGQSDCATFYTLPKPDGGYGPDHWNIQLPASSGMLILDVVGGEIACEEVSNRDDVRARLDEVMP